MPGHRIFAMPFSKVYPLYVRKAERKGRTKKEVDQIIAWEVDDPLMRKIRYLDKLIDELAKGKAMEKILRKQE
jgi:hypothetical protein